MQMIDEHHHFLDRRALDGNGDVLWLVIDIHNIETGMAYALSNRFPRITFWESPEVKTKTYFDLNALKELPFLEGLELACEIKKPIDLEALHSLEKLRELDLRVGTTRLPELDLQCFPQISELFLGNNQKFRGGKSLKKLRCIRVDNYTNDLAEELAAIPHLEELEIRKCKAEYLEGFNLYPNIRRVTLHYPQKLARLDEIAASQTLKEFSLEHPKHPALKDLSALAKSRSIQEIWILQKEIASCGFVRNMKSLRDFSCNAAILDNDIHPILDSKSLTYVSLNPMKKSYLPKMTSAELDEFFARKQA